MDDVAAATPRLVCASPAQFQGVLIEFAGRILGVLAYSAAAPADLAGFEAPYVWVRLPVLAEDACWYEVWVSSVPVTTGKKSGLSFASNGKLLFGSLVMDEADRSRIEQMAQAAYTAIFDVLDHTGYPELLRLWNYFPDINGSGCKMERYREFNVGRHNAFGSEGRPIGDGLVPAACALGTRQGPLVACFLAGRVRGVCLENPRQTTAYRYPEEYGPRSPTFSRGMLVGGVLLVSGTASIVGSRTMHPGDVLRQLDETLENLRLVISQARSGGFSGASAAGLCLNVYLRRAEDRTVVCGRIETEYAGAHVVYFQADVCRSDLLVEIEAFWMSHP